MTVAEVVLAILLLAVVALLAVWVRRWLLQRGGGTIEVSLRLETRNPGRGWVLGVGRFVEDDLQWFRVFSLALRPRRTLSRRDLRVAGQREPVGAETYVLLSTAVILECLTSAGPVELGIESGAVAGFRAWLEGAPPGQTVA